MGTALSNLKWLFTDDLRALRRDVTALEGAVGARGAEDATALTLAEVRQMLHGHVEATRARLNLVADEMDQMRKNVGMNSAKAQVNFTKARSREAELEKRIDLINAHIDSLDVRTTPMPKRHMTSVSNVFQRNTRSARSDSQTVTPFQT